MELVLASTSPYRRAQLESQGLPFVAEAPNVDEDDYKKKIQDPKELCQSLAKLKAQAIAPRHPENVIIGGDQLVSFKNEILGKAGSEEKAVAQLMRLQGQTHELFTALCLIFKDQIIEHLNVTELTMKPLSPEEALTYVQKDKSWDCAGSYKFELGGAELFSKVVTEDKSAITGLPMNALIDELTGLGF